MTLDLTVGWSSGVQQDLIAARASRAVVGRMLILAESTLRIPVDPTNPDEGHLEGDYYWRRAVPRGTAASDPPQEETEEEPPACNLIFVYRSADVRERVHGVQYVVVEIWTNERLAKYADQLEAIRASRRERHQQGQGPTATLRRWLAAVSRRLRRDS